MAEKSNLAGSVGVTVFLVLIGTNTNNIQQSLACSKTFPGTAIFLPNLTGLKQVLVVIRAVVNITWIKLLLVLSFPL